MKSRTDRLNMTSLNDDDRGGLIFDATVIATICGLLGLVVRFML